MLVEGTPAACALTIGAIIVSMSSLACSLEVMRTVISSAAFVFSSNALVLLENFMIELLTATGKSFDSAYAPVQPK